MLVTDRQIASKKKNVMVSKDFHNQILSRRLTFVLKSPVQQDLESPTAELVG